MPRLKSKLENAVGPKRKARLGIISLIAAARRGDLSKIRECLAQGLNVNGVAGGVALACALGGAAEKGRCEAIEVLLAAGADPNNPLLPKHATFPLDWAIFCGSADCVRLLLEAGANVNRLGWDDETALDSARIYNHRPIIELLKKHGAKTGREVGKPVVTRELQEPSADDDDSSVVNLSREANNPTFSRLLARIAKTSGVSAQASQNIRGGYLFPLHRQRAEEALNSHTQEARDAGCLLFRATPSTSDGDHTLVILPTLDRYIAVRGMQTNGANIDLTTAKIIRWLRALERRQPFVLDGIGYDFLEVRFTTKLKDVNQLASDIYEFCPDIVDQGIETVQGLAEVLRRTKRLFLWWD